MFEDSLLIIKSDYMHKRRPVLLKLLAAGFQIQGSRKLNFSPELAAEFYADYVDEKGFMLEVILLSKGISEAFILTKENGVQDLLNTMICYFGSASELERNIHVTKHSESVAREITFIFPNYIHEPIQMFDQSLFCNRPMIKPLISEIYDLLQNVDCSPEDWKRRISDYLVRSNPSLPQISNQCQVAPDMGMQEKSQQTTMTYKTIGKEAKPKEKSKSSSSLLSSSEPHSSVLLTTSTCVTCGGFERTEPCISELDLNKRVEPQSDEPICVDEEIIWKEIVVYEEVQPEEESEHKSEVAIPDEEGGRAGGDDATDSECDERPTAAAPAAVVETDSASEEAPPAAATPVVSAVESTTKAAPVAEEAAPAATPTAEEPPPAAAEAAPAAEEQPAPVAKEPPSPVAEEEPAPPAEEPDK
ncbi:proteoglycan 4 [Drosophila sulfurigaster albostrigata]|uniref:proteoglycan 4 n=1 Tax=Drosophila sulfurigaster albostrigata TaxID=89887 RepID=UPI002D21D0AA|nr:proteoglycan 4 [Drosophila sulfurigaster albostrigata]